MGTKSMSQPTNASTEFDLEVELKIFDTVSEEIRSRHLLVLGVLFTLLAGIIAAIISFSFTLSFLTVTISSTSGTTVSSVAPTFQSLVALVALVILGAFVALRTFNFINEYKTKRLPGFDKLLTDIRNRQSLVSVKEALRRVGDSK